MTALTSLPLTFPLAAADADEETPPHVLAALRPSEYTATLIHVLQNRADWVRDGRVLEIGAGSGVVLAAMGALGADLLCGVDIEPEAVAASALLLGRLGYRNIMDLYRGDMWEPLSARRFELIAANLPHFPMEPVEFAGRLPSWSCGGANGRRLLDRFLRGLAKHLAPGGRAVITHNAFVDLDVTRTIVARDGLSLRIAKTVLLNIPNDKLALMSRRIVDAEDGRSIHRYGPHTFAEMHIVEIGDGAALVRGSSAARVS
jgi:release factor glutamine methyltransferase